MSVTVEQVQALASACLLRDDQAARNQLADLLEERGLVEEDTGLRQQARAVWLVVHADPEHFDSADIAVYSSQDRALQAAAHKALAVGEEDDRVAEDEVTTIASAVAEGRWQDALDGYNYAEALQFCGTSVSVEKVALDPARTNDEVR